MSADLLLSLLSPLLLLLLFLLLLLPIVKLAQRKMDKSNSDDRGGSIANIFTTTILSRLNLFLKTGESLPYPSMLGRAAETAERAGGRGPCIFTNSVLH